ncbi:hypothetical protein P8452_21174 [Trifolium repens]|nr:hypothetical protein P8452_21174 [Trifolium repens]
MSGAGMVVKYPRCSIRRQSTYADAEEDLSMVFTLASTWAQFFAFGSSTCVGPMFYTINLAYQNATNLGLSYGSHASELKPLFMVNTIIFMVIGFIIGYPVASASVKVLHGLWRNDLAALKGSCPNCGEEVFAFVKTDKTNYSPHRAKCHVCECLLEFCTEVEQSTSRFGCWCFTTLVHDYFKCDILTIETPSKSTIRGLRVAEVPVFQNTDPSSFAFLCIFKGIRYIVGSRENEVDVPVIGRITIPLEKTGEITIPYKPDIDLEKIQFESFSFEETVAILHLKLDNKNDFDLGLNSLDYEVWLGEVRIGGVAETLMFLFN